MLKFLFTTLIASCSLHAQQIKIDRIEQMPNFPQPYNMRDWKQVAHDFDELAFNPNAEGQFLPLLRWDKGASTNGSAIHSNKVFSLPTFVGWDSNGYEVMTCLGALNAASVAGIDKSKQGGTNWVELATNYFNDTPGIEVYLNSTADKTGISFWYELFPNILFYRVFHHYPETPRMEQQFRKVADQWHTAAVGMGGSVSPYKVPNFKHTSYNFLTGKPLDNGLWTEGGSAAAIAWLQYMAFTQTGEQKYLTGTRWGLDFLEQSDENPFYEILFPHGPYVAARMNAEQGSNYDLQKLVNWCFDGSNKRGWGSSIGKWGDLDCAGLASSVNGDTDTYAFAMNTFNKANSLVPMVRYDDRFARSIGKWMLNAANSARLFYPNQVPAEAQTDAKWALKYDPSSSLAYEGLKQKQAGLGRIGADHKTIAGIVSNGSYKDTLYTNKGYQVLSESGPNNQLDHIWEVDMDEGSTHTLNFLAKTQGAGRFDISYSSSAEGPFKKVGTLASEDTPKLLNAQLQGNAHKLYLRVSSHNQENSTASSIHVDDMWIVCHGEHAPFATGDAVESKWGKTNLGLYGSAFAGIFGGIIETTNIEGILQLDCLATDYFRGPAFPTFLYYNPHPTAKTITVKTEPNTKLYDAVSNTFLVQAMGKTAKVSIPADTAVLLVHTPADGTLSAKGNTSFINDTPIDFLNK